MQGTDGIPNVNSADECQVNYCRRNEKCKYFVYIKSAKMCYLKTDKALDELDHETTVKRLLKLEFYRIISLKYLKV